MDVTDIGVNPDSLSPLVDPKSKQLNQDEFIGIIIAQLKNQSVDSPADADQYVSQLADFAGIEATQELTKSLQSQVQQQEFLTAANLVGKFVTAVVNNSLSEGVVDHVTKVDGVVSVSVAFDLNELTPSQAIGKDVLVLGDDGQIIEGEVESVGFKNAAPFITVVDPFGGSVEVPFANVLQATASIPFDQVTEIGNAVGDPSLQAPEDESDNQSDDEPSSE